MKQEKQLTSTLLVELRMEGAANIMSAKPKN
jgi:hypothetical protein